MGKEYKLSLLESCCEPSACLRVVQEEEENEADLSEGSQSEADD